MGIDKVNSILLNRNSKIRFLPGVYKGDLIISQKRIDLIGTKGVVIKGNVIVSSSYNSVNKFKIVGRVIVLDSKSGFELNHCFVDGALLVRENSGEVSAFNSIIHGISGSENKEINLQNCVLFKSGYRDLPGVISGHRFPIGQLYRADTLIHFDRRYSKKVTRKIVYFTAQ